METLKRKVEELIDEINIAEDIDEETHKKLNKLFLIKGILEDSMCFFQMSIDDAYNILEDLEVQNIKEKYLELVSAKNIRKGTN